MKISLNWIKEFTSVDMPVDELVEKIGAQLGAVEEVVDLGKKYRGIVVAQVVSCEKHPNADKLQVCTIDDGGNTPAVNRDENGLVQVVCGAPNVRAGMLVAWLPPGTVVPSTYDKDPLTLEARDIRGVLSNGMLASARELAISDDHAGILEVDNPGTAVKKDDSIDPNDHAAALCNIEFERAIQPGDDFAKTCKLDDYIIDIENKMFTHRPDCFGILGVAREIAGITGQKFVSPSWYLGAKATGEQDDDKRLLTIHNELPELVPRFMAQVIEGVRVKPSSVRIQSYLSRLGIRPINNIVDMTNYFMVLSGQPLHAYDYDKVKACDPGAEHATLTIRFPKKGEQLRLLNGKTIASHDKAILIATATQPIGVGGVMGGADTEVDENTQNIILECANFDMYSIRRTAMEHGLFTDAVTRFTKGQSPLQNDRVEARAIGEIIHQSGGLPASSIYDLKHDLPEPAQVTVETSFINERLGLNLSGEAMAALLRNVEFSVEVTKLDSLTTNYQLLITAPFWRTDIEIAEDIVEEVGRLYGYDKLPLELPKRDLTPAQKDELLELKNRVRAVLKSAGANEVLTYSFVHGNLLEKAGQKPEDSYQLSNALSPELQYYRQTLMPSLLDKVHPNIKTGYDEFVLFELNKTHNKIHGLDEEQVPGELHMLALTYAGKQAHAGAAYYQARHYLDYLLGAFNLTLSYQPLEKDPGFPVTAPYDFSRSALVSTRENGVFIGIIGEFRPEVARNFKLPPSSAGFEIGTEHLLEALQKLTISPYRELPKFPKVEQDISLKVPAELTYGELYDFVWTKTEALKPPQTLARLEPIDIYQREDDKARKHVTFRLSIASYERTLTAEEINALLDRVAAAAHEKFGAERM